MPHLSTIGLTHKTLLLFLLLDCLFLFPPPLVHPATTNSVTLQWSPNLEPQVAGYKLYHGTEPGIYGNPESVGNTTNVQLSALEPNKTHFFALTAYDSSGNESPPSTEVSIYIPDKPISPPEVIPNSNRPSIEEGLTSSPDVALPVEPAVDHSVRFEEVQTGGSARATAVITAGTLTARMNNLYLAAVATKPFRPANLVSGMGLTWIRMGAQCAGRNQTGVEIWAAKGTSFQDGQVMARFSKAPKNSVIAVSRYTGTDSLKPLGNVVSSNTNGLDGRCSKGKDQNSYSVDLVTTAPGSMIYRAIAMRHRTLSSGPGSIERGNIYQGRGGDVASVFVEDQMVGLQSIVAMDGAFSGKVDWAVIGLEIRGQHKAPAPQ